MSCDFVQIQRLDHTLYVPTLLHSFVQFLLNIFYDTVTSFI